MSAPYRVDAIYHPANVDIGEMDERIIVAAGVKPLSGGCGVGPLSGAGRDNNWYFFTPQERDAVANRITAANIEGVEVVRRLDLDPTENPQAGENP